VTLPEQFSGPSPSVARYVRHSVLLLLFASSLSAVVSCTTEPSPQQLQAVLVAHPEVLYAVVRAHPAEFVAVLNKASEASQLERQANATQAEARRIDENFAQPKTPDLADHVALGVADAPVTMVEYADFECPFCRAVQPTIEAVLQKYRGKVRLVIKQTPLDAHPRAMPAALMFEAVAHQGTGPALRFYDELYANQDRLKLDGDRFLVAAVRHAGANATLAVRDAQSSASRAAVARDLDEFKRFGFTGTPGFLINGVSLEGSVPESAFDQIIDRELTALHISGLEGRADTAAHTRRLRQ